MTTASIGMWVLIALIVFVLILVKKSLVIIPQSETKIIERLGKYYATLKPGINVIIPFIDRPKPPWLTPTADISTPTPSTFVNRCMISTSKM